MQYYSVGVLCRQHYIPLFPVHQESGLLKKKTPSGAPPALWVEVETGTATVENSTEFP